MKRVWVSEPPMRTAVIAGSRSMASAMAFCATAPRSAADAGETAEPTETAPNKAQPMAVPKPLIVRCVTESNPFGVLLAYYGPVRLMEVDESAKSAGLCEVPTPFLGGPPPNPSLLLLESSRT